MPKILHCLKSLNAQVCESALLFWKEEKWLQLTASFDGEGKSVPQNGVM